MWKHSKVDKHLVGKNALTEQLSRAGCQIWHGIMKTSDNISINDLDEEIESTFMEVNLLPGCKWFKLLWEDGIQIPYYLDKSLESIKS